MGTKNLQTLSAPTVYRLLFTVYSHLEPESIAKKLFFLIVNLLARFCSQRNEGTRQGSETAENAGRGAGSEAVNETRIIARIKQGDKKAFAEFVDAYGAKIHRLARRYASLPADAEDLTQEIFLELYRGIGGFRGESALSTWVYRVAVNRCLRYCQRERGADNMELNEDTQAFSDWRSDPVQFAANRELGEQVSGRPALPFARTSGRGGSLRDARPDVQRVRRRPSYSGRHRKIPPV